MKFIPYTAGGQQYYIPSEAFRTRKHYSIDVNSAEDRATIAARIQLSEGQDFIIPPPKQKIMTSIYGTPWLVEEETYNYDFDNTLPYGIYNCKRIDHRNMIHRQHDIENVRPYIPLPTYQTIYEQLKTELSTLLYTNQQYGKRTYLFYGPPGNGKTTLLIDLVSKSCGSAFIFNDFWMGDSELVSALKNLPEDKLKILLFEEVTEYCTRDSQARRSFLEFLDGLVKVPNLVIFASTNNPEQMTPNFIDRPGRFDKLIHFPNPTAQDVEAYIGAMGLEIPGEEDIKYMVSNKFSLAYVNEICLQVKYNNNTFQNAIQEQKNRKQLIKEQVFGEFKDKTGFLD